MKQKITPAMVKFEQPSLWPNVLEIPMDGKKSYVASFLSIYQGLSSSPVLALQRTASSKN